VLQRSESFIVAVGLGLCDSAAHLVSERFQVLAKGLAVYLYDSSF